MKNKQLNEQAEILEKFRTQAENILNDELTENQLDFLSKDDLFKKNIIDSIIEFYKSKQGEMIKFTQNILSLEKSLKSEEFVIINKLNDMLSESNQKMNALELNKNIAFDEISKLCKNNNLEKLNESILDIIDKNKN